MQLPALTHCPPVTGSVSGPSGRGRIPRASPRPTAYEPVDEFHADAEFARGEVLDRHRVIAVVLDHEQGGPLRKQTELHADHSRRIAICMLGAVGYEFGEQQPDRAGNVQGDRDWIGRSEEHTSELQSLMRKSDA